MQDSKQEQTQPRLEWWKCCPIYQICPRSFEDRNVASQLEDDRSMLWLYRRLIALRQHEPALIAGRLEPQRSQGDVLLFDAG